MKLQEKIKEVLKKSPLFSECEDEILEEFIKKSEIRRYPPDFEIVKEGESGESLFFIIEGKVEVFTERNERKFLDILKSGDFFGEFSFFTGGRRFATVKTKEETTCLEITKKAFEEISEKHPNFMKVVFDFYKIRVLDALLAHTYLFSNLRPHERKEILSFFEPLIVEEGKEIIKEGEEGDALYVIKDGTAEVFTVDAFGNEVFLAELGEGDFFGEVALITKKPRTATVRAKTKMRLLRIKKEDFQFMCEKYPEIMTRAEETIERRKDSTLIRIIEVNREKIERV